MGAVPGYAWPPIYGSSGRVGGRDVFDRRVTILVGHFGSGKTEIALNGALELASTGHTMTLADLDVVKP